MPRSAMKVTTVRFGADLWRLLEAEAALAGVSVSQYIREAALARAAAASAHRGDDPLALLAAAPPAPASRGRQQNEARMAGDALRTRAEEVHDENRAAAAQAAQAIRRSRQLRSEGAELRRKAKTSSRPSQRSRSVATECSNQPLAAIGITDTTSDQQNVDDT